MKLKNVLVLTIVFALSLNLFSIELKKSDSVITEKGTFDKGYMFGGKELDFSGRTDNLYFFGNKLIFDGESKSGIFAFGKDIVLNGRSSSDVRAIGRSLEMSGIVNGNVFIAGNDVTIKKDSVINGDCFIAGKDVIILGTINGNLKAGAGRITINGPVNGNVETGCGRIALSENAKIKGDLKYYSDREISQIEKGRISGNVTYSKLQHGKFNREERWGRGYHHRGNFRFFWVFNLFTLIAFIIGGLLLLLFPLTKKLEEKKDSKRFWQSLLWGLIPFLIYPAVIVLFIVLGVTFPLAIILFLAGLPVLVVVQILGVTIFGQYLFNKFNWKKEKRHLFFLFGLIFYAILRFIPFIMLLDIIFFSSLGWGVVLEGLFNKKFSS